MEGLAENGCIYLDSGGGYTWRYMLCCCAQYSVTYDSATPQTVARQAPLSMGLSRQEHWSGLPFPTPGDLPNPGIKPESLVSPALAGGFFSTEPPVMYTNVKIHRMGLLRGIFLYVNYNLNLTNSGQ